MKPCINRTDHIKILYNYDTISIYSQYTNKISTFYLTGNNKLYTELCANFKIIEKQGRKPILINTKFENLIEFFNTYSLKIKLKTFITRGN